MKNSVITFKADEEMTEALERIPNKSEFIRAAVANALQENCPLCGGTGTLSPHQKMHWTKFLEEHTLKHCRECHGLMIDCHHNHIKEEDNER